MNRLADYKHGILATAFLAVLAVALAFLTSPGPTGAQTQPQDGDERKFVLVDSAREISCGITENGVLRCWGNNWHGPVRAEGFKDVAVGNFRTCGLRADGTVQCWTFASTASQVYPIPVKDDGSDYTFSDIEAGQYAFCALQDDRNGQTAGIVRCWGRSNSANSNVPDELSAVVFAKIDVALSSACGLVASGTDADKVKCWGSGGIISEYTNEGIASLTFSSLTVGENHACGLIKNEGQSDDGDLKCWGSNGSHQISLIPSGVTFSAVSAGNGVSCGILDGEGSQTAGQVQCWGAAEIARNFGQQTVPAGLADATFRFIHSGYHVSCGILDGNTASQAEGAVKCWGGESNASNPINRGNAAPWEDRPALPPLKTNHDASTLGSGLHGVCALTAVGDVVCNGHSQYPYGPITGVKAVSAGPNVVCVVKDGGDDGKVECWGDNSANAATPPADATFSDLARTVQWHHNCGILDGQGGQTAGTVRCWGWNLTGQTTLPTELQNATFAAVGAGYLHTCGILDDNNGDDSGQMRCWGRHSGAADVGQADVPKHTVSGEEREYTFKSLGIGFFHSCGILDGGAHQADIEGQIKCWGWDGYGQSTLPEELEETTFTDVAGGRWHTCAVTNEGFPRCWGNVAGTLNDYGQVAIPVKYRYAQFDSITASWRATCGITVGGKLACWGADTDLDTEGVQLWIPAQDSNDTIVPNGENSEVIPNWFVLLNIGGFDPQPPAASVAWPPGNVGIDHWGWIQWHRSDFPVSDLGLRQSYAVRWVNGNAPPPETDLPADETPSTPEEGYVLVDEGSNCDFYPDGLCRYKIWAFDDKRHYLAQVQTQVMAPHGIWNEDRHTPPEPTPTPTPRPTTAPPPPDPTATPTPAPPTAPPPPPPPATPAPTIAPPPEPTATPAPTPVPPTPTPAPTATPAPTPVPPTPTPAREPIAAAAPTSTPMPTPTATPTPEPTATPTPTPVPPAPTPAPTATPTPTPVPPTPTPEPTATATPTPTPTREPTPTPTPTPYPTPMPTITPEPTYTPVPTNTPTPEPGFETPRTLASDESTPAWEFGTVATAVSGLPCWMWLIPSLLIVGIASLLSGWRLWLWLALSLSVLAVAFIPSALHCWMWLLPALPTALLLYYVRRLRNGRGYIYG